MAMCWIEKVHNFHKDQKLFFKIVDDRQPTFAETLTKSDDGWYELDPKKNVGASNFGVPWSGSDHALWVAVGKSQADKKVVVQFDIVGQDAWDYIRLRDDEYRERGRVEVGSMGAAAGTNFSGWRLVQHANGDVNLHCDWRQGLTKRGAESLGQAMFKVGEMAIEVIGVGLKAVTAIAVAALDSGKSKDDASAEAPGGGSSASGGVGASGGGGLDGAPVGALVE